MAERSGGTGTHGLSPRVRPGRTYALLAAFDIVIVGTFVGVGLASGSVPTVGELGPVATALTALVALNVGIVTVNQRRVADAREAWWHRAQWALEQSTGENVRARMAGQLALAHLARSDLATEDDLQLLAAIPDSVVARVEARVDDEADADIMDDDIHVVVVDVDTYDGLLEQDDQQEAEQAPDDADDDARPPAEGAETP